MVAACDGDKVSCNDNATCIEKQLQCDGKKHCPNGEDERDCGRFTSLFITLEEAFGINLS